MMQIKYQVLFAIIIFSLSLGSHAQDRNADRLNSQFSPNAEQLATLESNPDDHPVIVMKLLKFRNEDGRSLYVKHLKTCLPVLRDLGGELLFFGNAIPHETDLGVSQKLFGLAPNPWDYLVLQRYRSRKDLRTLNQSEQFKAAERALHDELEDMVIYALNGTSRFGGKRSSADTVMRPDYPDGDEIYMLNLLQFRAGSGEETYYKRYAAEVIPMIKSRGGKFVFGLMAEQPLLCDEKYDQVVLVSYPSAGEFTGMIASEDYKKISPHRREGLEIGHLYGFSNAGGGLKATDRQK